MTGLTEAVKWLTPLVLLAADTPAAPLRSNFEIDQAALVEAVGAVAGACPRAVERRSRTSRARVRRASWSGARSS